MTLRIYPPTIIVRHKREKLKKCSLQGLEERKDCLFYSYPSNELPPAQDYIILTLEAEELTLKDTHSGILLLDSTWKYTPKMLNWVQKISDLQYRSLPSYLRTAYPRRQEDCKDPQRGLASIEALFAAYHILKRPTEGLLDRYYWKDEFFNLNFGFLGNSLLKI